MVRNALLVCFMLVLGVGLIHPREIGAQDIARLQSGVVKITAKPSSGTTKSGTGFIVRLESNAAYIVTAAHVVAGDPNPKVEFFTKQHVQFPAEVLPGAEGGDDVGGLALLLVKGKENLPSSIGALPLASTSLMLEDMVMIGFPLGAGAWHITKGNIGSRQGRTIYFDPRVDSGNSGGPIIQKGKVVGVVMAAKSSGQGITVRGVQDYIEGFGITAQDRTSSASMATESSPPPTATAKPEPRQVTRDREVTGKDGAPMVLIPAGEFQKGGGVKSDERKGPIRHAVLDAYYMDKYEVTVGRYAKFLRDTGRAKPKLWDQADLSKHQDRPVVNINWYDARAYCEWTNKRLPTAAESEYAARGTDGRRYPWGNEWPGDDTHPTNYGRAFDGPGNSEITKGQLYSLGVKPGGSYELDKSPFGIYDMAGNAAEWVADWCCEKEEGDQQGSQRNPKGPPSGEMKLARGGNWNTGNSPITTFFLAKEPDEYFWLISGVRCAQDAK